MHIAKEDNMVVKMFRQDVVELAHKQGAINDHDLDYQKNCKIHNKFHGGITDKQVKALQVQYGLIKRWIEEQGGNPDQFLDSTPINIKSSVSTPTTAPTKTLSEMLGSLKGRTIVQKKAETLPWDEPKFDEKKLEKVFTAAEIVKEVTKPAKILIRTTKYYSDGTYEDMFETSFTPNHIGVVTMMNITPKKRKPKSDTDKIRCRGAAVVFKGKIYKSMSEAAKALGVNRHWIRKMCNENLNGWRYA